MGAAGNQLMVQSKVQRFGELTDSGVSDWVPRAVGKLVCGLPLRTEPEGSGVEAMCQHPARFPHLGTALTPDIQAGSRSPFSGRRQRTGEVSLGNWKESSREKCITI